MKKLRLLKVTVVPDFVVEDEDGNLAPLSSQMMNEDGTPLRLVAEVPAKDWSEYAKQGFAGAMQEIEAKLNAKSPKK